MRAPRQNLFQIKTVNHGDQLMTDISIPSHRARGDDRRAFWLLFALVFTLALPFVMLARLLPWRVFGAQSSARPSVIAEARSAASTAVGYAFMG